MYKKIDFIYLQSEIIELQEIMYSLNENEGLLIADDEDKKNKVYEKVLKKIDNLRENIKDSNIYVSGFTITFSPILINSSFSINFEIKE
jgi:Na+/phosphate symporter